MAPTIRELYARECEGWRKSFPQLRWVAAENLHLTLRFFGETPEATVEELRKRVEAMARDAEPFRLTVGEAGCFGSRTAPRVLWLETIAAGPTLARVQPLCETAAIDLGFEPEGRPWRPHL